MAKDRQKKHRVPRRIAGVKVSKPLRETAEVLLQVMDKKLVSDTLAAALVGGAGALAAGKGRRDAALAATLAASTAAIRSVEGAGRVGLAAGIAAAELAAGMTRLLADAENEEAPSGAGKPVKRKKKPKKKAGA